MQEVKNKKKDFSEKVDIQLPRSKLGERTGNGISNIVNVLIKTKRKVA